MAAARTGDPERVAVGYVAGTKGVRGEVGIEALTWDPERFADLRQVQLERDGRQPRDLTIERCRFDARGPLLKVAGVDTPEAAKADLVGGYLTVPRDEVPPLPEGAWYVFEVEGCEVWDEDADCRRGVVADVLAMPSTDVYSVRLDDGGEVLIPAVRDFVVEVDPEARRVRVRGMQELFDLEPDPGKKETGK